MIHNVRIAKTHDLSVDDSAFSPAVNDFIFAYGLRQILADAGSTGKNPDEKLAMAQKRLAALTDGSVRTQRAPRAGADPVAQEMRRMAEATVKAAIRDKGLKLKTIDPAKLAATIDAYVAKHEATLRDDAETALAARAAQVGKEVDLGDLGL